MRARGTDGKVADTRAGEFRKRCRRLLVWAANGAAWGLGFYLFIELCLWAGIRP